MKIKNDLVRIQIGSKTYDFHNLILENYLTRFVDAQLSETNIGKMHLSKSLKYCLLKFDTPMENVTESSTIHNQEFDIGLVTNTKHKQEMSNNQITIEYQYNNIDLIYQYATGTTTEDISQYYGRKITAIGFNSHVQSDENYVIKFPVCAFLDTSNLTSQEHIAFFEV